MSLPISVPYTFASATTDIPLSQLDADFTTVVNGVNGIGNGANQLANVSITGGTITGITPLGAAAGGTGLATITANNVILGNGTGIVQVVAPGTTGNVLTSDGTTWKSQVASGGVVTGTALTLNPYAVSNVSSQSHGLGATPSWVDARLVCITAELGYAANDCVMISGVNDGAAVFGLSVFWNSTSVGAATFLNPPKIINKSTLATASITVANWKLIVTPYKL